MKKNKLKVRRRSSGTIRPVDGLIVVDDFMPATHGIHDEATSSGKVPLEEMLEALSCSERMIFLALRQSLSGSEEISARLDSGGTMLVAVHVPSKEWRGAARAAFIAFAAEAVTGRPKSNAAATTIIADRPYSKHAARAFRTDPVFESVNRQHLAIVVCPDDVVPDAVEISLDGCARLEDLPFSFLRDALRSRFPGADVPEDGALAGAEISPDLLDNLCMRFGTPSDVLRLLETAAASARAVRGPEKPEEYPKGGTTPPRGFARTEFLRPVSPRLSDLHGYGAAGDWGTRLCEDMADYRAGRISWNDVDAGCLLCGPPGTGKTLFAAALAASAALPLVVTSYSDWQSQGEAHGGTLIKTMRMRFKDAGEETPCIVFIDEIDAIPARGGAGRNADWWTAILTALLECLDGSSRRDGLVVLAACNHPETLDPALVRSGRLDRRFTIGLPGEDDLLRIFLHHLPGLKERDVAPAATALAGICSGADAGRISREARRIARRANRELAASDLLDVALPPDPRPADLRRLAAVHEAGHAVAYMRFGLVPRSLSIIGTEGTHGGIVMPSETGGLGQVADIDRMVVPLLSGRAAEDIVFGQASAGAGGPDYSDLARATSLIADSIGTYGIGGRLLHGAAIDPDQVELKLRRLYAEAFLLMSRHRSDVLALAELALARRVLSGRDLARFAGERGLHAAPRTGAAGASPSVSEEADVG